MKKKASTSKEVTEKESKKTGQTKYPTDERETSKKSFIKSIGTPDWIQALAAVGTLVFVWFAYSAYSYQSRYDSFAEYSAVLQASSGPSWVFAKMTGKKLAKIESLSGGSGAVFTGTIDTKIYHQVASEQLVLLDEKFGKLDGLMYLNEVPERESVEDCYNEIRSDLQRIYTSFPTIVSTEKMTQQQDEYMYTAFRKINAKVDKHLQRTARVINDDLMNKFRNLKGQASIIDWGKSGFETNSGKLINAESEKSACND